MWPFGAPTESASTSPESERDLVATRRRANSFPLKPLHVVKLEEIYIRVEKGQECHWEFLVQEYDIRVSVVLVAGHEDQERAVLKPHRVRASDGLQKGRYDGAISGGACVLALRFDNSFSFFREKDVKYSLQIVERRTASGTTVRKSESGGAVAVVVDSDEVVIDPSTGRPSIEGEQSGLAMSRQPTIAFAPRRLRQELRDARRRCFAQGPRGEMLFMSCCAMTCIIIALIIMGAWSGIRPAAQWYESACTVTSAGYLRECTSSSGAPGCEFHNITLDVVLEQYRKDPQGGNGRCTGTTGSTCMADLRASAGVGGNCSTVNVTAFEHYRDRTITCWYDRWKIRRFDECSALTDTDTDATWPPKGTFIVSLGHEDEGIKANFMSLADAASAAVWGALLILGSVACAVGCIIQACKDRKNTEL